MIRESVPIIETIVGADALPLVFTIRKADGTALDLTSYTAALTATFDGATKISAAAMTKTDATNGILTYQPTAGEINVAGDYRGRIWLIAGTARRPVEDVIIRVKP